jgi:predicted RNase H-like HicB family nuclease
MILKISIPTDSAMIRLRNRMLPIITAPLLSFLLISSPGCSGRKTAFTYLPPKTQARADAAELKKQAEQAWQRRDKTASAEEALDKYEAAFQANSGDTAVAVRCAQANFFMAEYVMAVKNAKPRAREHYFERGLAAGERALELHEGFRAVNRDTRDEEKALQELDQAWVPAIFWTYANMVRWYEIQNPLRQLGNNQRLEIYRKRLRMLNDEYYYGGVYRLSGVVGEGDTEEVRFENAYEKALFLAPDFFSNYRVYVEKYALPKKQFTLADSLLKTVVNGNPKGLPENMYEQEISANLQKKEQDKLAQETSEKTKREFKPRY